MCGIYDNQEITAISTDRQLAHVRFYLVLIFLYVPNVMFQILLEKQGQ
jgi:hypothetical protein